MISDAVVIGVVLGLVFAAACYYLYTRSSSLERKVSLMENILLDLKVTTEQALLSATEAPLGSLSDTYERQPTTESTKGKDVVSHDASQSETDDHGVRTLSVDSPRSARASANTQVSVERDTSSVSTNYEAMTYKELIAIAKQKGVSGTRNASKAHVIELLRRHDAGGAPSKQTDVADSLDAHFTTTPLDDVEQAGTDLELLSANEMNKGEIASLDVDEVDASLVQ